MKKDQAVEFDAVRGLAAQLKGLIASESRIKPVFQADNVKTLATIASMQEGVEQKDTIIKRLQEEVTATHEKNALVSHFSVFKLCLKHSKTAYFA